jgi:AbrB family looped-hinge helix DNA binding protein
MSKPSKISQIDAKGQIVIPKELRDKLKVIPGTGFAIFELSKDSIILKKIPEVTFDLEATRKLARRSVK